LNQTLLDQVIFLRAEAAQSYKERGYGPIRTGIRCTVTRMSGKWGVE